MKHHAPPTERTPPSHVDTHRNRRATCKEIASAVREYPWCAAQHGALPPAATAAADQALLPWPANNAALFLRAFPRALHAGVAELGRDWLELSAATFSALRQKRVTFKGRVCSNLDWTPRWDGRGSTRLKTELSYQSNFLNEGLLVTAPPGDGRRLLVRLFPPHTLERFGRRIENPLAGRALTYEVEYPVTYPFVCPTVTLREPADLIGATLSRLTSESAGLMLTQEGRFSPAMSTHLH